jgi:acyl transferase domain-containing protein/NADPH:quinone reductase-like Zn-dependent oxidoreductase/thioesterase domain-containing protein/acyl carrier protein
MSELAQRLAGLSPAQRQLLEQRLAAQRPTAEPIAIIGMACRFPGSPDLAAYWRLIHEGIDAVGEIPNSRWNIDEFYDPTGDTAGKMSVRWAALIDGPDQFDPQFFGITPREAARMDPQQRLLLEVAWEAMENAGRPADQMAGTRTGVFVGIGGTDYSKVPVPYDDYFQHIDAHMGTGNALSIAANRLSYIFDLHGPSAAIDTACSSSSLSIHFAVESLRRGESDAALAGGVNMILTPETTIAFSKARMLSPEGKCRPFDAEANGYVRGEGCGLVLLKRLADAQRDGDNILAVLRATSVNQDGRTSGISAPNSQSQIACIRAALKQAGLSPEAVGYVEAHGTGTPLGDPIEMQALCEIFAATGAAPPCYVSSVKANVGHMETVSGVAGLIKLVLMLQHDDIPPQLHFRQLNPHIKLDGTRLVIPTEHVAWPRGERPRIAGVSSFGFGGTNTHLVVEAPDSLASGEVASATGRERPLHLLKLSGKTEAALTRQAERLASFLAEHPDAAAADVCYSANTGWSDFHFRAAVVAKDAAQLRERLEKIAAGESARAAGVKQSTVQSLSRPKVAMLFTGQGLQYVGMGRELYESQPVFREAMARCDEILRRHWHGQSLLDILYPENSAADDPTAAIHQTQYTQPALFALGFALAELWKTWGVVPDVVLGHSVGEYAAACVAGVMSLDDGLALIAERARLMQGVKRHGKMAVVFAPQQRVAQAIAESKSEVVVAVVNGPENTVISGDAQQVERLAAAFEANDVEVKLLNVSHAFHSPLMDEMLDEFEQFAAGLEFHPPHVPLVSNLTGQLMTDAPTARYWRDHLRNTVQFAEGMDRVAEAEPSMVLELGPTASLLGMGRRCVPKLDAAWLPSLRQGQADWQVLAASVAEYYARGGQIDWRGWDRPWPRRRLLLPNYPFERARHWFALDPSLARSFGGAAGEVATASGVRSGHPLLGTRLSTVWNNLLFETSLSGRAPAWLNDHQVQGSPVTPAAAYIEQGLAAAEQLFGPGGHALADLSIQQAMFLPEGMRRRVQVSIAPESGGQSTFETYSRPADDDPSSGAWAMHATGRLLHEANSQGEAAADFGELSRAAAGQVDLQAARDKSVGITTREDFYRLMTERGLAYGPVFQVLDELHRGPDAAVARVVLPDSVVREAGRYHLHPALGDALLQSMAGAVPLEADGSFSPFTYMPVGIRRVRVAKSIEDFTQPLFTFARRTTDDASPSPERVEGDVYLVDEAGDVLVAIEGVAVQRLGRSDVAGAADSSRWLYRVAWEPAPVAEVEGAWGNAPEIQTSTGAWLIFADSQGVGRQLADRLSQQGLASVLVEADTQFQFTDSESGNGKPGGPAAARIDPLDDGHYRQLFEQAFLQKQLPCLGVVHLWSLDIPKPDRVPGATPQSSDDVWQTAQRLGSGSALQLVRTLARTSLPQSPSVWFVTTGANAVDGTGATHIAIEQAPLLGLVRVAALEHPDLRPRLVDLDPAEEAAEAAAAALSNELMTAQADGEIAFRGGRRYSARLVRHASAIADASGGDELSIPAGKPFQLRITKAGSFDALRYVPVHREPPEAGQVEIEVRATGLNFSDVLKALGLYPGIKDEIVPLGIEASGVVTAVGPGVDRLRVGDEVLGVVPYAFASHARTAEYALVPKPASIDHDEACTIPITFLTAYYALVHLAHLQPGERVLIHAGAGGVGLAAIQIAQHLGAEVFATAGSDEKRDFLRSLGVRHIYSSRTLDFADEILAATDRQGVDVVLNSLPGEAITKSLSILQAYGRFLEIGKIDIYQNRMIGLLPFQDNLSYFAIDLDRMLRQRPEYIRGLFAEVMEHFAAGQYQPLLFTRFEAEGTIDAFRYMSQRKNIGKVVVALESQESRVESQEPEGEAAAGEATVRKDGTYLVTGGLGALGLQVAGWLADEGAGAIALVSRRRESPEVADQLAAIRNKGSRVVVLPGDVTDAASLAAALGQLPGERPPLRGVVHAAGVLADGVLADMDLEQFDRAMRPKVQGAWNLHVATQSAPLDWFVMFSSVASVLGSPGQGNYAAGNALLDVLAAHRRAHGLPATTINWGPWSGAGMAGEAGRGEAVQSRGMGLLPPERALDLLGKLLRSDTAQIVVMDAQWDDMFRLMGSRRPSLLAEIASEVEQAGGAATTSRVDRAFLDQLLAADEPTRHALVSEYIRDELARIMGVEPESLDAEQPLSTFGLDSLLALELKNNLEGRLDFTLPMAKLMEGPSITSLAQETVRLVASGDHAAASAAAEADQVWTPLLALRSSGTRHPLVLLPALGGDVRCYAELVQQLGPDQPVYAFRPRGVDQDLPPHRTMDEMIDDYVKALRKIQPTGPYYLAGWSTGGIYAFALAEALQQAGEEVALVALLDTPLPTICDEVDVDDDTRFLCDLVNFANCFTGTDIRLDYDELAPLTPTAQFQAALAEARRLGTVSAEAPEAFIRRLVHVGEANVQVIQSYRPQSLTQTVHLFVPTTKGGLAEIAGKILSEEGDHGWNDQIGQEMDLHEVPGDHFSMLLGDGAVQIARHLDSLMAMHVTGPSR